VQQRRRFGTRLRDQNVVTQVRLPPAVQARRVPSRRVEPSLEDNRNRRVVLFAASTAGPVAAITPPDDATRSAASAGNRSFWQSAQAILDRNVLAFD